MQAEAQSSSVRHEQADVTWLMRFIMRRRGAAAGALICGGIGGITGTIEPYLIGTIIDRIQHQIALDDLAKFAFLLIGLAVITVAAFFGQRIYSGVVAYQVNFDIRRTLFDNLLTLDQGFFQHYATGDLISRMYSDLDMIWRLLVLGFTRGGSAVVTVIVTFILLATINLPLTIMEEKKLLESEGKKLGLDLTTEWVRFTGGPPMGPGMSAPCVSRKRPST